MSSLRPSYLVRTALLFALLLPASRLSQAADIESNHLKLPQVPVADEVLTFNQKYCLDCHSGADAEASYNLSELGRSASYADHIHGWKAMLRRLIHREMPPADSEQPTQAEYEQTIASLKVSIRKVDQALAMQKPRAMRRLNAREYNNTIRDLFGIDYPFASRFPEEPRFHGFDNIGESLSVSPTHINSFLSASQRIAEEVIPEKTSPAPMTTAFDYQFYKGNPFEVDGPIKVRNGNSFIAVGEDGKNSPHYWIDGPFHVQFRSPASGYYRFIVRCRPVDLDDGVLSFRFTVNNRQVADFDLTEEDFKDGVLLDTEVFVPHNKKLNTAELTWRNGIRATIPRVHYKISKLARDQGIKSGRAFTHWPEEVEWPHFRYVQVEVEGPRTTGGSIENATSSVISSESLSNLSIEQLVNRILPLAFRRDVDDAEIRHYVAIGQSASADGASRTEALRLTLAAILNSPHFLYLVEEPPSDAERGSYQLTDFELASRLSYFLWSTMPDEELFAVARARKLSKPEELRRQAERMLADPKAAELSEGFGVGWTGADRIRGVMPEPFLFKNVFSTALHDSMAREPSEFFDTVRRENRSLINFIDSDFVVINAPLAELYQIDGVKGFAFRKVDLPDDSPRGGLLTQAGILTMTSEATRTSPVKRGIYLLETIFNRPPDPPPPNAGSLEAQQTDELRPVSSKLAAHRENPACASCHQRIDPYGLAMENFDPIGRWRDEDIVIHWDDLSKPDYKRRKKSFAVASDATLGSGEPLTGLGGLKTHLLSNQDRFLLGLTERMLTYAIGRELLVTDEEAVQQIVEGVREQDNRFNALIREVVLSEPFRTR
ncbi:DUF1592 domain-containing protein [Stratiformator vulcanicus]|uniref:DUF1592 domain-containing protein n=1 Tax=Stratiformator vulcanicus TaxID=2527980 RepID=UPI002877D40F|nr:DUF1592 domain-containing protein [Stratiformator vulcanicus]